PLIQQMKSVIPPIDGFHLLRSHKSIAHCTPHTKNQCRTPKAADYSEPPAKTLGYTSPSL
ncbi:MAG: hypothetical protein ABWY17_21625, partial [Pseudomonas sp.]